MDDTFQVYINRVARLTLPEAHRTQLQHIQTSPKFRLGSDGAVETMPFPGFSVITPPWRDDAENSEFYSQLQDLQQSVVKALPQGLLIPVPPESFHVTLADLIWDGIYRDAAAQPNFDQQLRDRIAQIFREVQPSLQTGIPAYWQMLGLAIRTRAISVCLAPKDEGAYEQVLTLRRAIYQNSELMGLGIEQQYHLTAHITLGYFGNIPENLDRDGISETLSHLNLDWLSRENMQSVWLHRAELRKFDDMTYYYREPDWPVVEL